MPRKIKELIRDLERAGFRNRGGKGSHRNFIKKDCDVVTISGKLNADAQAYQEKKVRKAIFPK